MSIPAGKDPTTAAAPQARFDQLRCRDCGNPVGAIAGFGFCRLCGEPLCFYCASNNVVMYDAERLKMVIPLLVVTLWQTRRITSKVSACRQCIHEIFTEKSRLILRSVLGCVIVALCLALPMILAFGPEAVPGATMVGVLFGILSFIAIYPIMRHLHFRKHRPACPVCGRNAVGLLFKAASLRRAGRGMFPDYIDCGCGYQGPRAPFDGLWVFVDKRGPGPLAGSPVDRMARAAAFTGQKRR